MIDKLNNSVLQGDCLELMKDIPDGSVDLILSDLPYGTTNCKWDTIIPFEPLWEHYKRIIKPNGAIVLTASQPFTSALVMSNPKMFKYELIWYKDRPTGLFTAKIQPMKYHENILVFCEGKTKYNPEMWEGNKNHSNLGNNKSKSSHYNSKFSIPKTDGLKNPKSVIYCKREHPPIHPTQKPVALFEYLIKTYTNEGDLVLDNVAGSGTTGVAALNTNRNYILMEKEPEYVEIIKQRLADHNDKPARQTKLLP
jgi:site-specific DNA-methyltransferase (adenine-specific)